MIETLQTLKTKVFCCSSDGRLSLLQIYAPRASTDADLAFLNCVAAQLLPNAVVLRSPPRVPAPQHAFAPPEAFR